MKRHALVCSYNVPQPDRDSGSQRIWDLIGVLRAEGWKVTFLASQGVGDARYVRQMQQRAIAVLDGLASPLEEVLASSEFQLALFAFWPIAEYYMPVVRKVSPMTRVIVDSLDLHFLRDARRIFGAKGGGLLNEDYASQMRGELNTYAAADRVLTVSQKEADLINDLISERGLACRVPDAEGMEFSPVPFAERRGMAMVASYSHPPNVQAAGHLCREIFPKLPKSVREEHPLFVVGNGLNETVRGFADGLDDVRMVGWVPDVAPYFQRTRISVVPLLYGAGTKRKVIQSLMAGTPVVTTSIGAEGLDVRHGEHVMIADDAESFAGAIGEVLRDEALWSRLRTKGRALIEKSHSREKMCAQFAKVIRRTLDAEPKPALLPEITREDHHARHMHDHWQRIFPHIGRAVAEFIPAGVKVALASDGCPRSLGLSEVTAVHFTEDENARRNAWRPMLGASAPSNMISRLEQLRGEGAEFLVVPDPLAWWRTQLGIFSEFVAGNCRLVAERAGVCAIYDLSASPSCGAAEDADIEIISSDVPSEPELPPLNLDDPEAVRLLAFYLPQFHPIPENDEWWGEGFTEWRNVVKAQPLFPGHHQPQLPADMGYYDLRSPETRADHARLARKYGVSGFCYYHYWFSGKRLIERPFNDVLASGEPDFPFCLCWANEPWSRQWDGRPNDVLQAQTYSEEDDLAHIRALIPALSDPRAITIQGRPLFIVYQGRDLPAPERTVETWRGEVERAGLPGIYLVAVETGWDAGWDATQAGFDAKLLFQPQFSILRTTPRTIIEDKPDLHVFDYNTAWPALANPEPVAYRRYDSIFPAWDNTARKGDKGWVVHDSTPEAYGEWLSTAIVRAKELPAGERIVFLNAWNEWAEGAHLEPDRKNGRAYLEATRSALLAAASAKVRRNRRKNPAR